MQGEINRALSSSHGAHAGPLRDGTGWGHGALVGRGAGAEILGPAGSRSTRARMCFLLPQGALPRKKGHA